MILLPNFSDYFAGLRSEKRSWGFSNWNQLLYRTFSLAWENQLSRRPM